MLSVSVHKDIGEYTEKVVGKLSLRTLACVVGGMCAAVAAAAFSYFLLGVEVSDATLPVMACSMPFWLAGFWRPCGMKVEAFIPLWVAHVLGDGRVLYESSVDMARPHVREGIAQKADRRALRRARRKGAELYEPSEQEQA